jgi:hypothetical protein
LSAQPKSVEGLDALTDDALLDELAARGMDSLLEHAFAVNKVPKERQDTVRTLVALRRLSEGSSKLTGNQRQKLIADVVKGIEAALPTMRDPRLMMRQAADLIAAGVERDVNTLEYWGENPRTQGQLRPVVQTVIKLLDRCVQQATADADAAANRIRSPDDKAAVARYEQLEQLARDAEYTKFMTDYYLVLSIDRADPRRREIATAATEYLKQYDVPEQPIRARVRNRLGKLAMTVGDFDAARGMFDLVIKSDPTDFTGAKPDVGLQYEARYFRSVTDLLAGKTDASLKGLESLEAWQSANLPNPATAAGDAKARAQAAHEGASAAAAMLKYRILSQQAASAGAAERQKLNDQAAAVLMDLLRQQPTLQGIIYEQLAGRMAENTSMAAADVVLLQALVRRGEDEVRRADGNRPDTRTLEQALAAAAELTTRKGIDPGVADSASLLRGFFLDRLERDVEATRTFLDYIARDPSAKNATLALDNAQAILGQLRQNRADDKDVIELYERFLPLAIGAPFERRQFAYEYARRLQLQGKPDEALKFFALVPDDDRRALAARFFQTIALQQKLDQMRPDDPQRPAMVEQVLRLAGAVRGSIDKALAGATSDEERSNFRSMLVRTTLLAAEMARAEQNDPARALSLLEGFERSIEGLPDANRRLTDALLVRVQALMALNRYGDATGQLVQLLDREPARGGRIVYDLLEKLNAELDKAQGAGNAALVRSIAGNRAQLTGFLVDWARKNPNESVKKLAYGYAVFDAEVQRFAAVQEPDEAKRREGLTRALDLFVKLNTPEGAAAYKASLPSVLAAQAGDVAYDPAVVLGLARTQFDLARYAEARDGFSRLLNDRRLGPPVISVEDKGELRETDNDNYWEAVLKLIRANVALGSGIEESRSYLKEQLVRWGDRVGGKKWRDEFAKLRAEIIPTFDPNAVPPEEPTTR